jgi:hypothetical protein
MRSRRGRRLGLLVSAALGVFAFSGLSAGAAQADPFHVEFNHGTLKLGSQSPLEFLSDAEPATLDGTIDSATGDITVPAAGVDIPPATFSTPLPGSISSEAVGDTTGNFNAATGQLDLDMVINSTTTLSSLGVTCHFDDFEWDLSTENTTPFDGERFTDGLDDDGAVDASWTDIPPARAGDPEACTQLVRPLAAGPGGVILEHSVPPFALTVTKAGTGTGSVTSSPAGIDCGATCAADFDEDEVVTLTAVPDTGQAFDGWSGAGCSGTGTCEVTMDSDQDVTATFKELTTLGATVDPTTASIKQGKTKKFTLTVENTGDADATDVEACIDAPSKPFVVKGDECVDLGTLTPGGPTKRGGTPSAEAEFTLKAKNNARPKKYTVDFTASSPDVATDATDSAKVTVKKKRRRHH